MAARSPQGLGEGVRGGRNRGLPMARPTAYLASWHVQRGTPLYVLKELGGWQTLEMVNKYAHLAPEHLTSYAERVTLGAAATSQMRHSDGATEKREVA